MIKVGIKNASIYFCIYNFIFVIFLPNKQSAAFSWNNVWLWCIKKYVVVSFNDESFIVKKSYLITNANWQKLQDLLFQIYTDVLLSYIFKNIKTYRLKVLYCCKSSIRRMVWRWTDLLDIASIILFCDFILNNISNVNISCSRKYLHIMTYA